MPGADVLPEYAENTGLRCIGDAPYANVAEDITDNCPEYVIRGKTIIMLRIACVFIAARKRRKYDMLMDRLHKRNYVYQLIYAHSGGAKGGAAFCSPPKKLLNIKRGVVGVVYGGADKPHLPAIAD